MMKSLRLDDTEETRGQQYPMGTSLCLGDKVLDILGIEDMTKYNIGQEVTITAKAVITSLNAPLDWDGDCIQCQITEMDVSTGKKLGGAALYGKDEESGEG